MKRLALFLFMLLLTVLPALAEEADDPATLCARLLPGYTYADGELGEGIFALLADSPDGERRFYGCVQTGSGWDVTESKPLPPDAMFFVEDWPFEGDCTIGFEHPGREGRPWLSFALCWDGEAWRIAWSTMNARELIRYEDGCITSDMYDDWYGVPTFSLAVAQADWLTLPATFREAMARVDTSGCEALNADWSAWEEEAAPWEPNAEAVAFGQSHLPGYTVYDGRAFAESALLLADDAQGVRYFFGCVLEDDTWVITRSAPLPEGTRCETFHAGKNWLRLWIDLPRERQTLRLGFDAVRCTVAYFDGAWQISCLDVADGYLGFGPCYIYDDEGNVYWGDLPWERDVTRADFSALPGSFHQALDMMDLSDWLLVSRNNAALHADADESAAVLGRYFAGAPCIRLDERDGMVQVRILASDVTGWMRADALIPASVQGVYNEKYASLSSRWTLGILDGEEGTAYLLGVCGDGCCYHAYDETADATVYLPLAELPLAQQIEALVMSCAGPLTVYDATADETAFIAMLVDPAYPDPADGRIVLACGVLEGGKWEVLLSASLPEGAWVILGDMEGFAGTVDIRLADGEICTYTIAWDGLWTAEGDTGFDLFPADKPELPGYAVLDGWTGQRTAMYLAQQEGATVFLGCVKTADGWQITESTPLPAGAGLNTYHASEGYMELYTAAGDYAVALQDGAWRLTWANDVSIGDTSVWFGVPGPYYGTVLLERDITRVDWAALPVRYEDWLSLVDASRWAVVCREDTPLLSDDGSVLALYQRGTAVQLLEKQDGLYRVEIGHVTGWMAADALLIGESQLTSEDGYLTVAEDGYLWGDNVLIAESPVLLDAPEGRAIGRVSEALRLLGIWPEGWLHVLDEFTGRDGFVRETDCMTYDEWLNRLHDEYGI